MNWKELVGNVAPILGTALGGPFGGMAGKWLAGELGVEEEKLEETVAHADPELMLKIKGLDNNFKTKMAELGLKTEQLHASDRGSARNMAINTTLMPQAIISCVFIVGFIVVLYAVFTGAVELKGSMLNMANILIGILSAGIMQIMNFFFGSSSGSKEKTRLIND